MATTVFGVKKPNQSIDKSRKIWKPSPDAKPAVFTKVRTSSGSSSNSLKKANVLSKPTEAPKIDRSFKAGISRVANVLNPFANNPIYLGNPSTGNINTNLDVGGYTRTIVRASEAALLAPKIAALFGGGSALATTAATAATSTAAQASKYAIPALAAGSGLLAGGLLFGRNGTATAPQELNQTPQQNTNPTQTTNSNLFDYSQNQQYQTSSIANSPGASLYGSQQQTRPTTQTTTPQQTTSPFQDTSGNQSQEATTGENWGLIAAIAAGAYILTR